MIDDASPEPPTVDASSHSRSGGWPFQLLAIVLSLFVLTAVNVNLFAQQPNLALFGGLGVVLIFLSLPMIRSRHGRVGIKVIDGLWIALAVASFGYIFVQSEPLLERFWIDGTLLGNRAGNELPIDYALSAIGVIVVLEATRRAIGWTLPILCGLFFLYALFGPQLPDWLFPHAGLSWQRIVQKTFLQSGGVFGIALRVMFMYVFLFVLFGTLLEQTGATRYVIDLARKAFGHSVGGPAKVAVVSSGLMGSLSGSAVANTATTGTFTIPLMRTAGFKPEDAAGIEAAASAGGALVPPVMGAGAYMMLEMVDPPVTYVQIIRASIVPAILYYVALLSTVHFHASRLNALKQTPEDSEKSPLGEALVSPPQKTEATAESLADGSHAYQGLVFFGAFVILIGALLYGWTPFRAVSISLGSIVLLSLVHRSTRIGPRKILAAMVAAGRGGMALIVAASCVGIILGIVDQTGIGAALPEQIQSLAGDSPLLALAMLMISTIILGMGLPSAVCYLLMAILVGSVLTRLDTPPLAAHLFIFYFGMMSMVTPPVALAAYTAAAIARADVMRSAIAAFRFALVGFALPFSFVLQPELLLLTHDGQPAGWSSVLFRLVLVSLAILGWSTGLAGFTRRPLNWLQRGSLILAGAILFLIRAEWNGTWAVWFAAGWIVGLWLWTSPSRKRLPKNQHASQENPVRRVRTSRRENDETTD